MEKIWNMIKSNLRKDYLINPLKMIFPFLGEKGEKEPVSLGQAWNLLMARPRKMRTSRGGSIRLQELINTKCKNQ